MSEAVRKLSAAEITAAAERHIDEYLDSGYDLEAADIQAAVDAGVDPKAIAAIWAHAKGLRPSGPKPADFFCETVLPEVAKPKASPDWRARFNQALAATKPTTLEEILSAVKPKEEPKVEPEPEPEIPEPEVEAEAEPEVEPDEEEPAEPEGLEGPLVRFSNEMPKADDKPATLSPSGPYDTAKEYVRRKCWRDGLLATYFWQNQFWEWNGKYYEALEEVVMQDRVTAFLDESKKGNVNEEQRFRPKPSHVGEVLFGLKTGLEPVPEICTGR